MYTLPIGRKGKLLLLLCSVIVAVSALAWRLHSPNSGQAQAPGKDYRFTNHLIGETSPYLLEHAHNPVDWYPWGPEALDKAKRENRPIFLSVGYSACHWCHVMAREDFENEEIAQLLNANFVCIKVDREQRPDIDSQYMPAVQLMTGSGGWPLSVFLTPDRKPFYGGTYFPRDAFKTLLEKVADVYKSRPEAVRTSADRIAAAVEEASASKPGGKLSADLLRRAESSLTAHYDSAHGGFSQRPKFPEAPQLAFLLARYRKTGDKNLLHMVTHTLDEMAAGGIYDQLGGGFHRYSTDALWRVPHFEKMLYDQALLVPVYLDAYQITHMPRYRQVAQETLDFVAREMRDKDGGFYSTIDADSEGEEGKFYLWTEEQVRQALGSDATAFDALFGVTEQGDLDGKSVLHLADTTQQSAKAQPLAAKTSVAQITRMREKLLTARNGRVRPNTDDKVLANWNGLMIVAYARAYQVLGEPRYRKTAEEAARFLIRMMMSSGELLHSYRAGKADVPGMLEDYAFVADGLEALYVATQDRRWLDQAQSLISQMTTRFSDRQRGGFYATGSQGDLLTRMKDGEDNATPSGNGVAAQVLVRLAALDAKPIWRIEAAKTIEAFQPIAANAPSAFPSLLMAYQELGAPESTLASSSSQSLSQSIVSCTIEGAKEKSGKPVSAHPGETISIILHIRVRQGWHINAHNTSDKNLTATDLHLNSNADIKLIAITYPDGRQVRYGASSAPISVYKGEFTVPAKLRLSSSAQPGLRRPRFTLTYQPCNDHACLAPAKVETELPLQVR